MKATLFALACLGLPVLAAAQGVPGRHFVESWDADADGEVTLVEIRARRGDVFYAFDTNGDGVLQSDEYDIFDEARAADMAANGGHQGNAMRGVNAGMLRETNDPDGDGLVSEAEFVDGSDDWLARLDRTGDGIVTLDDFALGQRGG